MQFCRVMYESGIYAESLCFIIFNRANKQDSFNMIDLQVRL